jgi:hypothetical protein
MEFIQNNPWITYLVVAGIIAGVGYAIYTSVIPSKDSADATARSSFSAYSEVTKLAPLGCPTGDSTRFCDYYIASSAYSVFPGAASFDYISDNVIPLVAKAGARLVELHVYAGEGDVPVVGLKNDLLGTDYAYNNVPFDACCVAIANTAFNKTHTAVSSDPFILSLVFHTNKPTVLNAASEMLKTTCRTYMLGPEYSYQRKNLAIEPICNLQGKLVVVSGPEVKGTHMEELVNLSWGTSHLRRLTYMQASQPYDHEELINHNRDHITMVVPEIGMNLVNSNPEILFAYGCQWNLMTYGSLDSMMELYMGHFQENSLIVKPAELRPLKPKKYKKPTLADPSVSFQPMRKTTPIYDATI